MKILEKILKNRIYLTLCLSITIFWFIWLLSVAGNIFYQFNKNTQAVIANYFYPNIWSKDIIMVGSTNDQYLNVDEAIELQSKLNIGLKILKNAGHINADSGYGPLSCAIDWIEREME